VGRRSAFLRRIEPRGQIAPRPSIPRGSNPPRTTTSCSRARTTGPCRPVPPLIPHDLPHPPTFVTEGPPRMRSPTVSACRESARTLPACYPSSTRVKSLPRRFFVVFVRRAPEEIAQSLERSTATCPAPPLPPRRKLPQRPMNELAIQRVPPPNTLFRVPRSGRCDRTSLGPRPSAPAGCAASRPQLWGACDCSPSQRMKVNRPPGSRVSSRPRRPALLPALPGRPRSAVTSEIVQNRRFHVSRALTRRVTLRGDAEARRSALCDRAGLGS